MTRSSVLIASAILLSTGSTCRGPEAPSPMVTIDSPSDGATVSVRDLTVSGTFAHVPADETIWVVVWPELAPGQGWPQSPNAAAGQPPVQGGGLWSSPVSLGGPPQSYVVAVYTASPAASATVRQILTTQAATEFFGVSRNELGGIVEHDQVTIVRTD